MMKKLLGIMAALALLSAAAHATLVGSLHMETDQATNGFDSVAGLVTRTSAGTGDANTQGTIAGSFSFLPGPTGSGYTPAVTVKTNETKIVDLDRFSDDSKGVRGIAVWDFDVSSITTNAWELKVDFSGRRTADALEDNWYISFNGLGRTLDTTDVTALNRGDGSVVVNNTAKFVKVGELPAGVGSGTYSWDLTEIIQAAQANDGKLRIVYACDGYKDDIKFVNDSGLIGTDTTSATPVTIPDMTVLLEDDFSSGSATNSGNAASIINGWASQGPEEKVYNMVSTIGSNFTGKLGFSYTGTGSFDGLMSSMTSYTLEEAGDYVSVSFDYTTTDTVDNGTGLRVRLYEAGSDLQTGGAGLGINLPSGTSTGSISYRSYVTGNPFSTGTSGGSAASGPLGNGGTVIFTATRTSTNTVVLSGWHSVGGYFEPTLASTNLYTFNAFGISVGSLAHGLEIDNVQVRSSMTPPVVYIDDDFESGSASDAGGTVVLTNGWSGSGPENKDYNTNNLASGGSVIDATGMLVIQEVNGDEKGNSSNLHAGYWDSLMCDFNPLALTNIGDYAELTLDVGMLAGTSTNVPPQTDGGNYVIRFYLGESSATTNSGYGMTLSRVKYSGQNFWEMKNGFDTQGSKTTVGNYQNAPTNGTMETLTFRMERIASGMLITSGLGPKIYSAYTNMNAEIMDNAFDQFGISLESKDAVLKLDNVLLTSNVDIVPPPPTTKYEDWETANGVTGGPGGDDDGDGLNNFGEYVFGGDPVLPDGAGDQGTQPVLQASAGDYIFQLIGDSSVTAYVLTRSDLISGSWSTGTPVNVSIDDGVLGAYTNNVDTSGAQLFIKLLVE